jgi:hypothetical protein
MNRYLEWTDDGKMPPSGFLILIPAFLFILIFFSAEAVEILG